MGVFHGRLARAKLPNGDSAAAKPPNPLSSSNANKKLRRILSVDFGDFISRYLPVSKLPTSFNQYMAATF